MVKAKYMESQQNQNLESFAGARGIDYCDGDIMFKYRGHRLPAGIVGFRLHFGLALYCRSGELTVRVSGGGQESYHVSPGSMYVYEDGNVITGIQTAGDFEFDLVGYSWSMLSESPSFKMVVWPLSDLLLHQPVAEIPPATLKLMRGYFRQMRRTAASPNEFFKRELVGSLARSMLYEYLRIVGDELKTVMAGGEGRKNQITRRFLDILAEGQGTVRSVKAVAAVMKLSPKYLSRVVMETTGERPVRLVNRCTLRNAGHLLRDTELSVRDVARQMGFGNFSFFSRFISTATGLTPTEYRRRLREKNRL